LAGGANETRRLRDIVNAANVASYTAYIFATAYNEEYM
jgi:hypothetical protein